LIVCLRRGILSDMGTLFHWDVEAVLCAVEDYMYEGLVPRQGHLDDSTEETNSEARLGIGDIPSTGFDQRQPCLTRRCPIEVYSDVSIT